MPYRKVCVRVIIIIHECLFTFFYTDTYRNLYENINLVFLTDNYNKSILFSQNLPQIPLIIINNQLITFFFAQHCSRLILSQGVIELIQFC